MPLETQADIVSRTDTHQHARLAALSYYTYLPLHPLDDQGQTFAASLLFHPFTLTLRPARRASHALIPQLKSTRKPLSDSMLSRPNNAIYSFGIALLAASTLVRPLGYPPPSSPLPIRSSEDANYLPERIQSFSLPFTLSSMLIAAPASRRQSPPAHPLQYPPPPTHTRQAHWPPHCLQLTLVLISRSPRPPWK